MVREIVQTHSIDNCKVRDFFEILYSDSTAARDYHREVDKDDSAQVEDWQGNVRTVNFTMPMQIPQIVAKLIGTSSIPVREVQKAETDEDGGLHITSTPEIGVPGGSKFVAVAKLFVTDTHGGCVVEAKVVCTAGGPFGLKGMIEGIMAEQSAASVRTYINFCSKRCQARLSQVGRPSQVPGSPTSDSTVFDQFFDAQETLSRTTSFASITSDSTLPSAPVASEFADTVAILKLIDTLEGRLALLSSDLTSIRGLLSHNNSSHTADSGGHRRMDAKLWLSGFSCGAAVVACAWAVFMKQRGSLLKD